MGVHTSVLEVLPAPHDFASKSKDAVRVRSIFWRILPLGAILLVASVLRLWHLGQSSLWYDEVVTMHLARTAGPAALLRLLRQIDATRAPLHPLLLQAWVSLFGASEVSARAQSALCGILTVALVYWLGLQSYDAKTGLWAAWLSALSPLLVYYSREVRMYAWLVLITCLAWGLLNSHRRSHEPWKSALYALVLVAIAYSHPLGLLMIGTLAATALLFRRAFQLSWWRWLLIHAAVFAAVLPWLGNYLDHPPESVSGPLPVRFLLGMPIGFIGGDFKVLFVCLLLCAYGLVGFRGRGDGGFDVALDNFVSSGSFLLWLVVPPLVLYEYSRVAQPVFGPARYTLYVGPAYLILVSRGLAKLPWRLSAPAALAGAVLSGAMLMSHVYRPDLKADWRGAAAYLSRRDPGALVAVVSPSPPENIEVETARYYLGPRRAVIPCPREPSDLTLGPDPFWVAIGMRAGRTVGELPAALADPRLIEEVREFTGLRLMRIDFRRAPSRG
jgi:mannosyltransferase